MSSESADTITDLLLKWRAGDKSAVNELMPLVHRELHRLAVAYLRRERANHSLQPTALINEAYLRLVDQRDVDWQGRAEFYGLAAKIMRNILVDHARGRQAAKRGGAEYRVTLDGENFGGETAHPLDIIAIHEALERLAAFDSKKAEVVELRFFGGLSIEETATAMHVGHATVERDWKIARAWLKRELQ